MSVSALRKKPRVMAGFFYAREDVAGRVGSVRLLPYNQQLIRGF